MQSINSIPFVSHCINAISRDMRGQRGGRELQPVLSLALEEGGGQYHAAAALRSGKARHPYYMRLVCLQKRRDS
jgi:hypothetical protein